MVNAETMRSELKKLGLGMSKELGFNNTYGLNAWSIAGGILLILVAMPVALWAWHSWLPLEREVRATGSGNRLQLRHIVLVLLAFAAVAGYAGLNHGSASPPAGAELTTEV